MCVWGGGVCVCVCVCVEHKNTNILYLWCWKCVTLFFFVLGKTHNGASLGIFEKVLEMPHYMFCLWKKIISRTFRISGTLIVIMAPETLALKTVFNIDSTPQQVQLSHWTEWLLKQGGGGDVLAHHWKIWLENISKLLTDLEAHFESMQIIPSMKICIV